MNRHGSINRIYRLVWNHGRAAWVPVAETASGAKKAKSQRSGCNTDVSILGVVSFTLASIASGAPTGGKVVSGAGTITQSGTTTDVQQVSSTLLLNWQSFNVASQETVNFIQPSATAIAVNRILGNGASQILGHLDANGQVFLINPNGVIFGKGAEVNVGGLVASTLDLNDPNFIGSAESFSGSSVGSVVNRGTITAAAGGYVALLGARVGNQGLISATLGTVALGAGSAVTLTFSGHSLVHLQVDRSVLSTLADNGGVLRADGGQVLMTAGAKDSLMASVVNNTGIVEARTVENHGGSITLLGGMRAGEVTVGGTLDASAPLGGNGGEIVTSAARVEVVSDATVSTAAARGLVGSWLVDPNDFTVAASGGDITGATLSSELNSTSVTLESSSGSHTGSGNVNVNDPVSWSANTALTLTASNNVNVNASITATGAAAGLIVNPNAANGSETASGAGTFTIAAGVAVNLPNVSPTSKTAVVISGTPYTVINSLGAAGSTTGTDLQGIAGNLGGNYALGSNIDATSTSAWNAGAGFTSINNFGGALNGLGHAVNNLNDSGGLFASTTLTSIISNTGVSGTVNGGSKVGALVGTNYGTILNAYSTATVTGTSNVGGLVGYSYKATISNSYSTGTVTGSSYVGGLVGYNHGSIVNSFATGAVNGSTYVGGLVGAINGNYPVIGSVSNSFSTGNVTGGSNVGGLVGASIGGYGGQINNSYATGNVSGNTNVGGLLGFNSGGNTNYAYGYVGSVGSSHASGSVSGTTNVGGLVGLNSGGVGGSYATGSVTGTSAVGGLIGWNGGAFAGSQTARGAGVVGGSFASGSVSGSSNVGGLVGINGGAGGYYGLVGTINSSHATGNVNGTSASTNIGGLVGYNYGLVTDSYARGNVTGGSAVGGLIGSNTETPYPNSLTINLSNSYATGNVSGVSQLGGLVGANSDTTIDGSHAGGSVTGTGDNVGGLVGSNSYAGASPPIISNSYATGNVSGRGAVGGLVGGNDGAYVTTISNDYATGNVAGVSGVGGLIGSSSGFNSGANILFSYATGSVNGTDSVGGLIGSNGGVISGSFAAGNVKGTTNVGGLVGFNANGGYGNQVYSVSNSSASGTVTGSTNVGGLIGDSEGSVTHVYASGNVIGVNKVGGLVGYSAYSANNGTPNVAISNSYATGAITASTSVGGLVGDSEGLLAKTYATGSVSGTSNVGGLVGYNGFSGTGINESYSAGHVSGSSSTGGLVGSNLGTVTNSFWDTTLSGQGASAGGIGMTTAQMQTQVNFTTATAANGNQNPNWDFASTWVIYNGHTYPLLSSFMTPLTVTANSGGVTYDGAAYGGSLGVTYSTTPNSNLLGTLNFGNDVNVGNYTILPSGLYSNQQGYIISYVSGSLKINQLASVAWTGGTTGNWSDAANWAGGAIPDYANVAVVSIPAGVTVTYDGAVPGSTMLNTLTNSGNFVMSAGSLSTTGSFSTAGYQQLGGSLNVGGVLTINSLGPTVALGNISAGSLVLQSQDGPITQLASSALDIKGSSSLIANNGASGSADVKYGITLTNSQNNFVGAVTTEGTIVSLTDGSGGIILGSALISDALTVRSLDGTITQSSGTAITDAGSSSFTADNGMNGSAEVRHSVTLANATNNFAGVVSTSGLNIYLNDNSGGIILGNTTASGTVTATSLAGAITQAAGTDITVTGTSTFTADNGVAGSGNVKHSITLTNADNTFVGAIGADGLNVNLTDATGGIILGKTIASSTLTVDSSNGAISQLAGTTIVSSGASSFTADNAKTGGGAVQHSIVLGNAGNNFVGSVLTNGSNITLEDSVGGIILNNTTASGTLTVDSTQGALTQKAGTGIVAAGIISFTANNAQSGTGHVTYDITLINSANKFSGSVATNGFNVSLDDDSSRLQLNNTLAAGTFTATSRDGVILQKAGTDIDIAGTSSFTADNETNGSNEVYYDVTLANANNRFGGAVSVIGATTAIDSSQALTTLLSSAGAVTLDAAGPLKVSGTVATNLTTITTGGSASTTTFGMTTVGDTLVVTSPGVVTTTTPSTALTVDGAGTHLKNTHVTVNQVVGALIE